MMLLKCAFLALCLTEVVTAKPVQEVDAEATDGQRQKRLICATCVNSCTGPSCGGGPIVVDRPVPVPKPVPVPIPVPRPQPKPFPVPVPVPVPPPPPKVVPVRVPVPVQSGCTTGEAAIPQRECNVRFSTSITSPTLRDRADVTTMPFCCTLRQSATLTSALHLDENSATATLR
uniref:Extensin-like n=1 Tax=Ascaris lumbricoides TaxID=6252 RepID=A0A0M3HWA0_ASCLU